MGNFYTFALLELFPHCYTLEKKHFARYPWTILPGPIFFYTSTASAASDKFHVCSLDVTLEVPPVSIGLGVSSWLGPPVDPWPVPCVGIIVDIIPVFVGDQDAVLEVSVEGIGFGVSPVGSGPSLDP